MYSMEIRNYLNQRDRDLDQLSRLAPKVDSNHRIFLLQTCREMILSLSQEEDDKVKEADVGYTITAGLLGRRDRIDERDEYRSTERRYDRDETERILRRIQDKSPSILSNIIGETYSAKSLRELIRKIEYSV